jgi:hypothetical protein
MIVENAGGVTGIMGHVIVTLSRDTVGLAYDDTVRVVHAPPDMTPGDSTNGSRSSRECQ